MAEATDPEGAEPRALLELADPAGRDVLEIGCGDGRLTWRYGERAASVLGIDPDGAAIERARSGLPEGWRGRVTFRVADVLRDPLPAGAFDIVILSRTLC